MLYILKKLKHLNNNSCCGYPTQFKPFVEIQYYPISMEDRHLQIYKHAPLHYAINTEWILSHFTMTKIFYWWHLRIHFKWFNVSSVFLASVIFWRKKLESKDLKYFIAWIILNPFFAYSSFLYLKLIAASYLIWAKAKMYYSSKSVIWICIRWLVAKGFTTHRNIQGHIAQNKKLVWYL